MDKSTTLKEVAKEAGVSPITVSRVFNNPQIVSDKTRSKVEEAANRLHYTPNALARALVTNTSKTISILVPDILNIYYPMMIQRLVRRLEYNGYQSIMSITGDSVRKEQRALALAVENRVAGAFLLGAGMSGRDSIPILDRLADRIPVIILGYPYGGNTYSVYADEAQGIFQAMEYLWSLGHRKIGFINGSGKALTYRYKKQGYDKACAHFGIDSHSGYYICEEPYFSGGMTGANRLLDLPVPPTAILTAGDQIAMGVYYTCYERGIQIPNDISVMGFSGTGFSTALYPALTTVNQFPEKSADVAVGLMIRHFENKEIKKRNIMIKTQIIKRHSCKSIL